MAIRSVPRAMPPLEAVAHETMAAKLYQQLREAIMSGRFAPGQPLSLRGVAEAVGSSTMPVRGALTRLQAEGALVDGPGRALMVPPMTLELIEELRDVRVAIEGCVAARAAARMTDAHLSAVQQIHDVMDAHAEAGDAAAYLRSNFAFHTSIYTHGASELTLATIQNMWMRIGPFLNMVAPDIAHMRRSMAAHRKIVDALWRRDGAAVRAGIAQDIGDAAEALAGRLRAPQDITLGEACR
ncbi:Predicted regulator PutR for proline utilization, GntR family [Caballeronia glathei]|uniref:DNA-binding protein n=2 Tax=Caballeronia glathei TaxID=60547 RepID=A0A069PGB3_9BURK|nr:DNA-binding protein [Caballeronia glathei]TCK38195.1 GntR family transcriptional regulator [Paraburkholderia sp. BL8N3]CDY78230.1 Predicted regulator PutR for proline utilization, GntR family [Caballeronia glathei]